MKSIASATQFAKSNQILRYAYALYLLLVIYLLFKKDYEWAVTNLAIAMVFDPFAASGEWSRRPLYQKIWLLCHLALTMGGFLFLLLR